MPKTDEEAYAAAGKLVTKITIERMKTESSLAAIKKLGKKASGTQKDHQVSLQNAIDEVDQALPNLKDCATRKVRAMSASP